jgi:hypothetical protein
MARIDRRISPNQLALWNRYEVQRVPALRPAVTAARSMHTVEVAVLGRPVATIGVQFADNRASRPTMIRPCPGRRTSRGTGTRPDTTAGNQHVSPQIRPNLPRAADRAARTTTSSRAKRSSCVNTLFDLALGGGPYRNFSGTWVSCSSKSQSVGRAARQNHGAPAASQRSRKRRAADGRQSS